MDKREKINSVFDIGQAWTSEPTLAHFRRLKLNLIIE
jgi:hypothetical protein